MADEGNALDVKSDPVDPNKTADNAEPKPDIKPDDSGAPEPKKDDASGKPVGDKGPEPSGAEKRIKQLVREKHERDRRIAELESRLQGTPRQEPPKPQTKGAPKPEDFQDYDDYVVAKATWKIKQDQAVEEAEKNAAESARAIKAIDDNFNERLSDDSAEHPEITEQKNRVGKKLSLAAGFAIKQSEIAPDIIRYLDTNPEEVTRLSGLDLVAAAREIGKIEVKLTSKGGTKVKSGAPEPHKPAGGGSGTVTTEEKSDDEIPMVDYMKKFRDKSRKK